MTPNRKEMLLRRLQAGTRLLKGESQGRIAREYRVSRTTVSRWAKALLRGGIQELRAREVPGRPSRLSAEDRQKLARAWQNGPRYYGIDALRWTCTAFTRVIHRETGIVYDPDHVSRLILQMGLRLPAPPRKRRGLPVTAPVAPVTPVTPVITERR